MDNKNTKIISVVNQKGGVAKTTTTFNLAGILANRGHKVLMIDNDPQASLTLSANYNPLDFETSICDVYLGESIFDSIYKVDTIENLDLIPSITDLAGAEINLLSARAREFILQKAISKIENLYEFIFIDCPPQLSLLSLNALTASNYVLIPCETSPLSYYALTDLYDTIEGVREDLKPDLTVLGIVATLYDARTNSDNQILDALKEHEDYISCISRSVEVKKYISDGLPVALAEPNTKSGKEYLELADKVLEKIDLSEKKEGE